jgi:hypothetical protein
MNKYEIISIPDNMDLTNPYRLNLLDKSSAITNVAYISGMTLNRGQWTWDSDERAYWICPGDRDASHVEGYIRLTDDKLLLLPGDKIEVEFDIKYIGTVDEQQIIGVRIDPLNDSLARLTSIDCLTVNYSNEWQNIKRNIIIDPGLTTTKTLRLYFGVMYSPLNTSGYSIKMRDIKITIIRNKSLLKERDFDYYGISGNNFAGSLLIDNATTNPTSGARDITLKCSIYGYKGSSDPTTGAVNGNGMLFVLPYRGGGVSGTTLIEQIAYINGGDNAAGVWKRSYFGSTSTWTAWKRVDAKPNSGNTSNRPTSVDIGFMYFDTSISKAIWWNGSGWVDSAGAAV